MLQLNFKVPLFFLLQFIFKNELKIFKYQLAGIKNLLFISKNH